jgi:hypothetical protein
MKIVIYADFNSNYECGPPQSNFRDICADEVRDEVNYED